MSSLLPGEEQRSLKLPSMPRGESRGEVPGAPRVNEELGQSRYDAQLWLCLAIKVKSDAARTVLFRNLEC